MNTIHWSECTPQIDGTMTRFTMMCHRSGQPETGTLACLNHLNDFSRATLAPQSQSNPKTNENLSEAWYITDGVGQLKLNGIEYEVKQGDGFIVLADTEYTIRNSGVEHMEFLVASEPAQAANRDNWSHSPHVRNYINSPVGKAHWHHRYQCISGPEDGLKVIDTTLVVHMLPVRPSEPHSHDEQTDEIWYVWKGEGIHVVDRELKVQKPGDAVCVTPCDDGHMLINHTDETLWTFYVRASTKADS